MAHIKALLFDFNGTLFFDSNFHITAIKEYFVSCGKQAPSDEYIVQNIFGKSNEEIYSANFANNGACSGWQEFAEQKENRYRQLCLDHPEQMKYTEGATALFDYLKKNGIPYAIAITVM